MIDEDAFSGRIAAIYTFASGLAPYINYSESFEPTTGTDSVTNNPFKPTTAKQIETGMKYQNSAQTLLITAAYFDLAKQNVVVNTPDFAKYTQNGEVVSKGIEIELHSQATKQLDVTVNFTQLDMEISKNALDTSLVGTRPVWVADKTASIWASYYVEQFNLSGLMLSAGLRYTGESYMNAANSDTVPSYTLIDLAASDELSDNVQLTMSVNNLANKRYVGACYDINNCWMGAERTLDISVQFSL